MIKKKYIKKAYIETAYCDKCGAEMHHTNIVLTTFPVKYPYACSNPACDGSQFFYEDNRPGVIRYEFVEEEADV
jgi:hypothetical protein